MATTIQVSEKTRQMLEIVKKKTGAKSLDEVIQKAMEDKLEKKSLFGTFKGKLKSVTRKERLEMWKDDRF